MGNRQMVDVLLGVLLINLILALDRRADVFI